MKIKVGTRGSNLAIAQTKLVMKQLSKKWPNAEFDMIKISTLGDRNLSDPLHQMQSKGVFVREIEEKLLKGEIDIAIHSLKDLPTLQPKGLCLVPPILCEDAADAIVWNPIKKRTKEIVLGTSSQRRAALIHEIYPEYQVVNIRGNIETRLKKMSEQQLDGIVMSMAAIHRLHYYHLTFTRLDPTYFIPACAQGILGIQIREGDTSIASLFEGLNDKYATYRMLSERTFLKTIEGGCHSAVGAYLMKNKEDYMLHAMMKNRLNGTIIRESIPVQIVNLCKDAKKLAKRMLEMEQYNG